MERLASKPKYKLRVKNLGPIMELDCGLSENHQNLIFATNGTGKTFLSRAFSLLDSGIKEYTDDIVNDPSILVSEESTDGSLVLERDGIVLGQVQLDCNKNTVISHPNKDTIFHVFSTEYVHHELQEKKFEINGEIEHQIIIGSDTKLIDELQVEYDLVEKEGKNLSEQLKQKYIEKKAGIKKKFEINEGLGAYKSLAFELYRNELAPDVVKKNLNELQAEFNKLKSLPSNPEMPHIPENLRLIDGIDEIKDLEAPISTASVSENFKTKIATDPGFFERGLKLLEKTPSNCPFCTQTLQEIGLSAISVYQKYFKDSEAKATRTLHKKIEELDNLTQEIQKYTDKYEIAISRYENLSNYFTSQNTAKLSAPGDNLQKVNAVINAIKDTIEQKLKSLASEVNFDNITTLNELIVQLNDDAQKAKQTVFELQKKIDKRDSERRVIQGTACVSFHSEFYISNKSDMQELERLRRELSKKKTALDDAKISSGDKADGRARVAGTFSLLLADIFGDTYNFDKESFTLLRKKSPMKRGGHRTLSEGEKTTIAFCLFIAQSHLKVENKDQYKNLFYVIDDPISSVSFDYVYCIARILKNLSIANNTIEIKGGNGERPKMLILTHHDYFFNVISTHRVVKESGIFELNGVSGTHILYPLQGFVSPHIEHLRDLLKVKQGAEPDHHTANSVRSVLEGMWKFVQPNIKRYGDFIVWLADRHNIEIQSHVLNNDLSHGGKFGAGPNVASDLKRAVDETLHVVDTFAPGQIEQVKALVK